MQHPKLRAVVPSRKGEMQDRAATPGASPREVYFSYFKKYFHVFFPIL